ncbi:MoaD/ThiS family protein [Natranaeroarchaeum aerophilus]|uniref:MoaD/ThiS family protein n=1 Tax=Natranaeroarchaeum aerophilus TaxID=2917711 RepID=A0AAE3FPD7_9EURY|nr:MoaD/ThiS family protein [Natranaeroarchaeum aerophilus]MCL9812661.1 MoaD/ThiS family protein [Natranaeroarchaeum aerophilus]
MGETRQRTGEADDRSNATSETTVQVRCTGHVRSAIGTGRLEYQFEGRTLREFLDAFFAEYDVRDMLIADTEAEATTRGWAPQLDELPGTYAKNPEGEQTRRYARVVVNGTFNEHLDGLDTKLHNGDRVALVYSGSRRKPTALAVG